MTIIERLQELDIELPNPKAGGVYSPAVQSGKYIYVSGQLPVHNGKLLNPGKLGDNVSTEEGYAAARICAINALGAVNTLLGSLENLRVIKSIGYVSATTDYKEHPAVVNGASELLKDLLGDINGIGARVAFGVASLPAGSSVEFELLLEKI